MNKRVTSNGSASRRKGRLTVIDYFHGKTAAASGVESWLKDYLTFSRLQITILGSGKTWEYRRLNEATTLIPICKTRSRRKLVPDVVRLGVGLIRFRSLLTDNLLVHRIELAPLIKLLRPQARISLVVHTNLLAQLNRGSDSIWRFFRHLYRPFERFALLHVETLVSHSSADFERLKRLHPGAELIPGWFNDNIFYPRSTKTPAWTFVWAGRLESVKDPHIALEAFKVFSSENRLKVLMIGEGSLEAEVRRRIVELGLEEQVLLRPPVTAKNLAAHLGDSQGLIHTSHYEGSSRVLLEALACGRQVVTFLESDPDRWVSRLGLGSYAKNRTPEALAEAMEQVLRGGRSNKVPHEIRSRAASLVVNQLDGFFC